MLFWIQFIPRTKSMYWFYMVYVDKAFAVFTIDLLKVEAATFTRSTMISNTSRSCSWITFIGIHGYTLLSTFNVVILCV